MRVKSENHNIIVLVIIMKLIESYEYCNMLGEYY